MNLESLYFQVNTHLDTIDFSILWKGFERLKFALYNQKECFFDGKYIEKDDSFVANTAIYYNGEFIAIWNVTQEIDPEVLASKIVHEMFHAFQRINNESRFANELEALINYRILSENLSYKYYESKLMCQLIDSFDESDFQKLLNLKKLRYNAFTYEYTYEALVEQIEGSAHFVEYKALLQISKDKAKKLFESMIQSVLTPSHYLPVRVISYSIGALFFYLLNKTKDIEYENFSKDPIAITVIKQRDTTNSNYPNTEEPFNEIIQSYHNETKQIIDNACKKNEIVLVGDYPLLGVNVYNARLLNSNIVTTFFVMYMDNKTPKTLMGDFVLELHESTNIKRILAI